jgi:hypothetical protein
MDVLIRKTEDKSVDNPLVHSGNKHSENHLGMRRGRPLMLTGKSGTAFANIIDPEFLVVVYAQVKSAVQAAFNDAGTPAFRIISRTAHWPLFEMMG